MHDNEVNMYVIQAPTVIYWIVAGIELTESTISC